MLGAWNNLNESLNFRETPEVKNNQSKVRLIKASASIEKPNQEN